MFEATVTWGDDTVDCDGNPHKFEPETGIFETFDDATAFVAAWTGAESAIITKL